MRKAGMKVHAWINYPNNGTKKCTRCGCIRRMEYINNSTVLTYEMNGQITDKYFECKG